MPHVSVRGQILSDVRHAKTLAEQLAVLDDSESDDTNSSNDSLLADSFSDEASSFEGLSSMSEDSSDSESDALQLYQITSMLEQEICSTRYLSERKNFPRSKDDAYQHFLNQSDADFRHITRVTKETFWFLHDCIKDNQIFHNNSTCPQAPVHWQLACTLDRLGNDGGGVSIARSKVIWHTGHGTIVDYYNRVIEALLNIRDQHIQWPDINERSQISARMATLGFKGCAGFVDGTTFPLYCKPATHGNTYLDRKRRYSINAQVVCDDRRRIRHFMVGMPGRCHDSRVFSQSPLVQRPELCFSPGQYLLADSGYSASAFLVPAYKDRQRDYRNDPDELVAIEHFNTLLAKARVVNEHCIGILKARWPSLRGLRHDLHDPTDIVKFNRHSTACVVLHNIALQIDPWLEDDVESDDSNVDEEPAPFTNNPRQGLSAGQLKRLRVRLDCAAFHA